MKIDSYNDPYNLQNDYQNVYIMERGDITVTAGKVKFK